MLSVRAGARWARWAGWARWALRSTWWRVLDYEYVVRRQVQGVLARGGADSYRSPEPQVPPDVVLVPGVYEPWQFLRPIAAELHRHGHPVHVLPGLGYNRAPVAASARVLGEYLVQHDLRDVVVVAHSKGGLIGKLAMLSEDLDGRIRRMVAVNTPFGGSVLARWVPLGAVRAFVPTDATLVAMAAERWVNEHITSVYSCWDPHIPGGSVLEGAENVEIGTPGHFRSLEDPELRRILLEVVRRDGPAAARLTPDAAAGPATALTGTGALAPGGHSDDAGPMTRFQARLRVPPAIESSVAGPFIGQLLQDPTDGEVVAQEGDAAEGTVRIEFLADDQADAELHARLLAERAPGCEVQGVQPA